MGTGKLRKILASEGLIKSAGWDGDVYFDSRAVDHPDFPTALKWAKRTSRNKRLIDNTKNDRPYTSISIKLMRGGERLLVGMSGELEEYVSEYAQPDIHPSVGGDYLISSGGGYSEKKEYVHRSLEFSQSRDGAWKTYAAKTVGHRREVEKSLTTATLLGALRKSASLIRAIA
jgi:hypothetical protein